MGLDTFFASLVLAWNKLCVLLQVAANLAKGFIIELLLVNFHSSHNLLRAFRTLFRLLFLSLLDLLSLFGSNEHL